MVMIEDYLEKIREVLSKSKNIEYAFIFGSALRRLLPESDVDILIGGRLNSFERINLTFELELILKRKVDVVLAQEVCCELVLEAFSTGLPVFS